MAYRNILYITIFFVLFYNPLQADLDFESIKKVVPGEEMIDFLKYHILRGYQLEAPYDPTKYNFTDLFSIEAYQHFLKYHLITDESVVKQVRDTVCFPDGHCVDVDDPGIYPTN